jgi:hypothetical protein
MKELRPFREWHWLFQPEIVSTNLQIGPDHIRGVVTVREPDGQVRVEAVKSSCRPAYRPSLVDRLPSEVEKRMRNWLATEQMNTEWQDDRTWDLAALLGEIDFLRRDLARKATAVDSRSRAHDTSVDV